MRVLSFQQAWPKLNDTRFTTFRFARKGKDWKQGELVNIVVKSGEAPGVELGIAKISIKATFRAFPGDAPYVPFLPQVITPAEAISDGFPTLRDMYDYFVDRYGKRLLEEPLNKLVLMYVQRYGF